MRFAVPMCSGFFHREGSIGGTDDDRAGLILAGLRSRNNLTCLRNLMLRDYLRQVDYAADARLVVEDLLRCVTSRFLQSKSPRRATIDYRMIGSRQWT